MLEPMGYDIRVVIHIDKGRRSTANHFPAGQFSADTYKLGVNKLDFGREYVIV